MHQCIDAFISLHTNMLALTHLQNIDRHFDANAQMELFKSLSILAPIIDDTGIARTESAHATTRTHAR
jgi:hypothetical protein